MNIPGRRNTPFVFELSSNFSVINPLLYCSVVLSLDPKLYGRVAGEAF
jgi:hypothetical protein